MYKEEEFVQISALQHFVFCKRQCALSYIEQVWDDNALTVAGGVMHENAHEERFEKKGELRIERGMPLRSEKYGLNGKADVVEFQKNCDGVWVPFPIEYKHGKPKENNCDLVQLCAQALCLEEMLNLEVSHGAIFYGKTMHRLDVDFGDELRNYTIRTIDELHSFIASGETPKAVYSKRCESCSLLNACLPKTFDHEQDVEEYIRRNI